jgi:thiamine-phosphate diphosphorylase
MTRPRLHLVTDDGVVAEPGFHEAAGALIEGFGSRIAVHLRAHGHSGAALYGLAARLAPAARRTGTVLVVNDRVDVALAAGITAVQLGRRSLPVAAVRALLGPQATLGRSVRSAAEAAAAVDEGADLVIVGTIFRSDSHPGEPGAGLARVRDVVARVRAPAVAIGGITPDSVGAVREAGARGVAVLGGVWRARDPGAAVAAYLAALG